MTKVIVVEKHGAPEVMRLIDREIGKPQAHEVKIRHYAIGLNYIDIYHRSGVYPCSLPTGLGMEAAGEVISVGSGVTDLKVGDRVAYLAYEPGSYAQERIIDARRVIRIPDEMDYELAAAIMLKGMTAQFLLRRAYPVQPGDFVLIHAAAGGVGLLLCQWAKILGAKVIGTVGSAEKADFVRAYGCDEPIIYTQENFADRVKEITQGKGVKVVYDSVGKSTFEGSLNSLAPMGYFVSFGNSSGVLPPIDPGVLFSKGSLFFTRPGIFHYVDRREDLEQTSRELFKIVLSGQLKILIQQKYKLSEIEQAHRELEQRKTIGTTIILP